MKVFVANKTPKLDVLSTFGLLNTVLKIFGLSCITRDGSTIKWSMPLWKISLIIFIVSAVNITIIYFKVNHFSGKLTSVTFQDTLQLVYVIGYQQYIVDVCLVYKFGRQRCVNYLKLYERIDQILGVSYYKNIRNCIRKFCLFFVFIWIIEFAVDNIVWIINFDTIMPMAYLVDYFYVGIKILSIIDMIANYIQMWYRLKAMADLLEDYYFHCENRPGVKNVIDYREFKLRRLSCFKMIRFSRINDVMDLPRCYLLLIEQCEYLNVNYGIRIIVGNATFILDMVMSLNFIIRLLMDTIVLPKSSKILSILSTVIRIISGILILTCGVYRCEQNYRQNERIKRLIDHLVLMKIIPYDVRNTLMELKELIITRPVKYHAMNFYQLEYATLVSISFIFQLHIDRILETHMVRPQIKTSKNLM